MIFKKPSLILIQYFIKAEKLRKNRTKNDEVDHNGCKVADGRWILSQAHPRNSIDITGNYDSLKAYIVYIETLKRLFLKST